MRKCPACGEQYPHDVKYCSIDGTLLTSSDAAEASSDLDGSLEPGTVLGNYRLLELIGKGGMGHIYSAEHTRLGRLVAIKVLRQQYASNPDAIKRFFQEARAVNRIQHENIVQITDFIEQADGENYYIMELLQGQSLKDLMREECPLPYKRSLNIILQVCRALALVHRAGIVHRDLKPDNIYLLERAGVKDFVKLLDFGVAKLMDMEAHRSVRQTAIGTILGTPAYMSAEQAAGKPVDQRADVYSVGIILYEMLCGLRPFAAETLGELVIQHLTVEPKIPTNVNLPEKLPRPLKQLVLRCLEKDKEKRPQSMTEVAKRIEAILLQEQSAKLDQQGVPWPKTVLWAALGAILLFLISVFALDLFDSGRPKQNTSNELSAETIQLHCDSQPQGATVTQDGRPTPLGTTPVKLAWPRSKQRLRLRFNLPEHEIAHKQFTPTNDTKLVVTLKKLKKTNQKTEPKIIPIKTREPVSKKTKRLKKKMKDDKTNQPTVERDGTLNPFGNE